MTIAGLDFFLLLCRFCLASFCSKFYFLLLSFFHLCEDLFVCVCVCVWLSVSIVRQLCLCSYCMQLLSFHCGFWSMQRLFQEQRGEDRNPCAPVGWAWMSVERRRQEGTTKSEDMGSIDSSAHWRENKLRRRRELLNVSLLGLVTVQRISHCWMF